MAAAGKRYPLVLYTHMLNRWWPTLLWLGLALFGLAWAIYSWKMEAWRWLTILNLGGLIILFSLVMFAFRKSAYVQPMASHLRLVTPFLRLNISYKRLRRTTTAALYSLFPPKSISSLSREILEPLNRMTAIVIELNGYPVSRNMLLLFLSPFFFKDKTPHLVILIEDWMQFSTELESYRAGGEKTRPIQREKDPSILSRLPFN